MWGWESSRKGSRLANLRRGYGIASESIAIRRYTAAMAHRYTPFVKLADRMSRIGTETAFEAAARARALEATGRSVIHLEIGEPDFDTPQHIKDAAARAARQGMTHYTAAEGIAPLRQAIADDVALEGDRGHARAGDRDPGREADHVLRHARPHRRGRRGHLPNPGFPIYESMTQYVGGVAVAAPLREERDFRMDVDEVASLVTPRTRMIVFNSPHNPTGSVLTGDDVRAIADIASATTSSSWPMRSTAGSSTRKLLSIATLPGMADRTITLDGFSKTFAMTGWRLGYGVVPGGWRRATAGW